MTSEPKLCACGCGEFPLKAGSRFLAGHNSRVSHPMAGRHHTEETKRVISRALSGDKSPFFKHGAWADPTYACWLTMRGRGAVKGMDPRWLDYKEFLADMGPRPSSPDDGYIHGYSLDRIDNSKGYFKWNCRWVTRVEQNANRTDPGGWITRRAKYGPTGRRV